MDPIRIKASGLGSGPQFKIKGSGSGRKGRKKEKGKRRKKKREKRKKKGEKRKKKGEGKKKKGERRKGKEERRKEKGERRKKKEKRRRKKKTKKEPGAVSPAEGGRRRRSAARSGFQPPRSKKMRNGRSPLRKRIFLLRGGTPGGPRAKKPKILKISIF